MISINGGNCHRDYGCFISRASKRQSVVWVFYKHIFLKSAIWVCRDNKWFLGGLKQGEGWSGRGKEVGKIVSFIWWRNLDVSYSPHFHLPFYSSLSGAKIILLISYPGTEKATFWPMPCDFYFSLQISMALQSVVDLTTFVRGFYLSQHHICHFSDLQALMWGF